MSDTSGASAPPPSIAPPAAAPLTSTDISPHDAAADIAKRRQQQAGQPPQPPAERAPRAEPTHESASSPEADATPYADHGEPTEHDPAERPSIEPPRSWTREAKEAFKQLPPEHQRWLTEQEDGREKDLRRRQNEFAEHSKAAQAEALKYQQTRQQYEYTIAQALQIVNASHQNEFADIRTQDDVDRMASEDWPRWVKWRASQDKLERTHAEHQYAVQQQKHDLANRFHTWASDQDAAFAHAVPEFKDPKKAQFLQGKLRDAFLHCGIPESEIQILGFEPKFRDARAQRLLWYAVRGIEAEKALEKAKSDPKSVPHVQRPGAAPARAQPGSAKINELDRTLERTGKPEDAAKLIAARRAQAQRRA